MEEERAADFFVIQKRKIDEFNSRSNETYKMDLLDYADQDPFELFESLGGFKMDNDDNLSFQSNFGKATKSNKIAKREVNNSDETSSTKFYFSKLTMPSTNSQNLSFESSNISPQDVSSMPPSIFYASNNQIEFPTTSIVNNFSTLSVSKFPLITTSSSSLQTPSKNLTTISRSTKSPWITKPISSSLSSTSLNYLSSSESQNKISSSINETRSEKLSTKRTSSMTKSTSTKITTTKTFKPSISTNSLKTTSKQINTTLNSNERIKTSTSSLRFFK